MQKKILFIRLDKIGDLVCTLCCDDHPDLAMCSKHWLISKGLEFIPEHALPKRSYSSLSKDRQGFKDLYQFLKTTSFDASISFQCPWWVHFLLFYFRIPIRVGVLSQWHSFLFLNVGLRQKRSQAAKHESDYNYDLVKLLVQKMKLIKTDPATPILKLIADGSNNVLKKWNLKEKSYFIVHPGMAGSSLNWPQERYIEFIHLFNLHYPLLKIVMTGTASDTIYLNQILAAVQVKDYFLNLQGQLNHEELLSLLSASSGLLAPSTGVMHLAASLGIPTFAIFSPIPVQGPIRWGPRGPRTHVYKANDDGQDDCMSRLNLFPEFKTDFEKTLR